MFTAALFTIAKAWKQPKCPSTHKCIKNQWYNHTEEYYGQRKNDILPFTTACIDLEGTSEME